MRKILAAAAAALLALGGLVAVTPAAAAGTEPVPPRLSAAAKRVAAAPAPQAWQYAPKGRPGLAKAPVPARFKPRPGTIAPPTPPGTTVFYDYTNVRQIINTVDGTAADLTIADPYNNYASDWHSIMQGAVQDDHGNRVEVGWTVSPSLCPSEPAGSSPCLFAYSAEGGVGQGYGVGFVPYAGADYVLGDQLPNPNDSSGLNFRIVEAANEWWLGVGVTTSPGYWVGYYPKTNWTDPGTDATNAFDQLTMFQWFTEVASTEPINATWNATTPCSDAGNGITPTSPNGGTTAARIVNVKTVTGATSANASPTYGPVPTTIPSNAYAIYPTTTPATNGFRVGGAGWKGNNTVPGATGGCG
jgi:hypothetical protein